MATYRLFAELPLSYTFTGEARDAFVTLADNTTLNLVPMSVDASQAVFKPSSMTPVPSNITFVRARLISSGAPGLEPAVGGIAGHFVLRFKGADKRSEPFVISFTKWNEWERQMVCVGTGEVDDNVIGLELDASESTITLDDYNIQEAYVGQDMTACLELEVECNGLNLQ